MYDISTNARVEREKETQTGTGRRAPQSVQRIHVSLPCVGHSANPCYLFSTIGDGGGLRPSRGSNYNMMFLLRILYLVMVHFCIVVKKNLAATDWV